MRRTAVVAAMMVLGMVGMAQAATRTWTGSWNSLPAATDDVIQVQTGGNLTWSNSFPSNVASWTQDATYSGTATFMTVYGTTGFTNFTIAGDATLLGGAWTHVANTTPPEVS